MRKRIFRSLEEKQSLVEKFRDRVSKGEEIGAAARELGVHPTQLYKWGKFSPKRKYTKRKKHPYVKLVGAPTGAELIMGGGVTRDLDAPITLSVRSLVQIIREASHHV